MIQQMSEHAQAESQWARIRANLKQKWPQLTDKEIALADGDTRKLIALVHQKTGADVHEIENAIDELAHGEESMAQRIQREASHWAHETRERVGTPLARSYDYLHHEVERAPMRSVLIAAGSGLLIGLCCAATFFRPVPPKRKEYRDYLPW